MKKNIEKGSSRFVFMFWKYALKIPSLRSYDSFLRGILANMQEYNFYRYIKTEKLCPIIFYLPGGVLNIMPKLKTLTTDEFNRINCPNLYISENGTTLPIEAKPDSFAHYNNKIVAVDYG
jgi:hypothetical protein